MQVKIYNNKNKLVQSFASMNLFKQFYNNLCCSDLLAIYEYLCNNKTSYIIYDNKKYSLILYPKG